MPSNVLATQRGPGRRQPRGKKPKRKSSPLQPCQLKVAEKSSDTAVAVILVSCFVFMEAS